MATGKGNNRASGRWQSVRNIFWQALCWLAISLCLGKVLPVLTENPDCFWDDSILHRFFNIKALFLNKVQKWTNGKILNFPLPRQCMYICIFRQESELFRNLLWVNKENQDTWSIIKENPYRISFSVYGNWQQSWIEPSKRNFREQNWTLPIYMVHR